MKETRVKYRGFYESELFSEDSFGSLCLDYDVFLRAFGHIDGKSSPGFPFNDVSVNSEVNIGALYELVNRTLLLWKEGGMPDDPISAFEGGYTFPASCFVKSEPTKVEKVARLIYGTSIVMNVIARILFSDFLSQVTKTWDIASHKVGLDFNSADGLKRVTSFYDAIYENNSGELVSDDIQGWEYQVRDWMHVAFYEAFADYADCGCLNRRLILAYAKAERLTMVLTSDGILNKLPFHITLSGVVMTHFKNSLDRAALAYVDSILSGNLREEVLLDDQVYVSTNGDDCLANVKSFDVLFSERIGFVHTDITQCTTTLFPYCSQEFFRPDDLCCFQRRPDGLAKILYSILNTDDSFAIADMFLHISKHSASAAIVSTWLSYTKFKRGDVGIMACQSPSLANNAEENSEETSEGEERSSREESPGKGLPFLWEDFLGEGSVFSVKPLLRGVSRGSMA